MVHQPPSIYEHGSIEYVDTTRDRQHTGLVASWDKTRGFGFINTGQRSDVFLHFSKITGAGAGTVKVGKRVTFDVETTKKGKAAINVRVEE